MHPEYKKHVDIVVNWGLLSMLMPLAIDMYLPVLPIIATEYGASASSVQMTLNAYVLGFSIGQLFYGPMADCLGQKQVSHVRDLLLRAGRDRGRAVAIRGDADLYALAARPLRHRKPGY